jgi:hypothetical protein
MGRTSALAVVAALVLVVGGCGCGAPPAGQGILAVTSTYVEDPILPDWTVWVWRIDDAHGREAVVYDQRHGTYLWSDEECECYYLAPGTYTVWLAWPWGLVGKRDVVIRDGETTTIHP